MSDELLLTSCCLCTCCFVALLSAQRLHIGAMKSNTRRPVSLVTHVDLMAALHRYKYDLTSAEVSLVALQRLRETRHNVASACNDARSLRQGIANTANVAKGRPTGERSTAGGSGSKSGSKGQGGGSSGEGSNAHENRWEDWSEVERAAFLKHVGDKVLPIQCTNVCVCWLSCFRFARLYRLA